MVGAEIEILIAKETSPAFVTVTLPWLLAGAMETARIHDALVTVRTFPTNVTLAFIGFLAATSIRVASHSANWFEAIVFGALPSVEADKVASGTAIVMAEAIVSGLAPLATSLTIVMGLTSDPILVAEGRMGGAMIVIGPIFTQFQPSLGHQSSDQDRTSIRDGIIRFFMPSFDDKRKGSLPRSQLKLDWISKLS